MQNAGSRGELIGLLCVCGLERHFHTSSPTSCASAFFVFALVSLFGWTRRQFAVTLVCEYDCAYLHIACATSWPTDRSHANVIAFPFQVRGGNSSRLLPPMTDNLTSWLSIYRAPTGTGREGDHPRYWIDRQCISKMRQKNRDRRIDTVQRVQFYTQTSKPRLCDQYQEAESEREEEEEGFRGRLED